MKLFGMVGTEKKGEGEKVGGMEKGKERRRKGEIVRLQVPELLTLRKLSFQQTTTTHQYGV